MSVNVAGKSNKGSMTWKKRAKGGIVQPEAVKGKLATGIQKVVEVRGLEKKVYHKNKG